MTYQEVANMIEDFGIPFAYFSYPNDQAPPLPYCVYYYPDRDDMIADNENYVKIEALNIEIYTEVKDLTLEERIEAILKANKIVFDRTESFINSENMYQILYESEVLINGE